MNRKTILVFLIIAGMAVLFTTNAVAEELTDASGQWKYVLGNGNATITGYVEEPSGELAIPNEIDGYAVTGISDNALEECYRITSVVIPYSVTNIGFWTFSECSSLISITVSSNNPAYAQIDGVLFDKSKQTLLTYPSARNGAYTVPEGVLHIESNAFGGCNGLTDVTIPGGVTSMGDYAFQNCENMASVTIEKGVTYISFGAFSNCGRLQTVIIPDSVMNIDVTAFVDCENLANVIIPVSVAYIGDEAFDGCDRLVLHVAVGSYAERYAKDNGIAYTNDAEDEENEDAREGTGFTGASGQWKYGLVDGGAHIMGYSGEGDSNGMLTIPCELDGYPVTGIGKRGFRV